MNGFTPLELAALRSIFAETPDLAAALTAQLAAASVTARENTGAGFFTTIGLADGTLAIDGPGHLGDETYARVSGMEYGLGFVLFLKNGRLHELEGYAQAGSTEHVDLTTREFEIYRAVPQRGPM